MSGTVIRIIKFEFTCLADMPIARVWSLTISRKTKLEFNFDNVVYEFAGY